MVSDLLETLQSLGVAVTLGATDRIRLEPASRIPAELVPRIREAKPEIIAALKISRARQAVERSEPDRRPVERPATCLPACLEQDGVLIHAEGCPTVEAMRRSRKNCVWFEAADPGPVGDAVRDLLRPGEWIDERGVIRKVQ